MTVKYLPHVTLAFLVLATIGCGTPTVAQSTTPENTESTKIATASAPPVTVASEWSKPVNGLKARWLVKWRKIASEDRPAYAGYYEFILEVKNADSAPLSFYSQPMFRDLAIRDANGKVIDPPGSVIGNHISGVPQWATIPNSDGAYLGLRIDTTIPVHHGVHFERC